MIQVLECLTTDSGLSSKINMFPKNSCFKSEPMLSTIKDNNKTSHNLTVRTVTIDDKSNLINSYYSYNCIGKKKRKYSWGDNIAANLICNDKIHKKCAIPHDEF